MKVRRNLVSNQPAQQILNASKLMGYRFKIEFRTIEGTTLKVNFFCLSVRKNRSKFQNTVLLLTVIQIWIDSLLRTDMAKKVTLLTSVKIDLEQR